MKANNRNICTCFLFSDQFMFLPEVPFYGRHGLLCLDFHIWTCTNSDDRNTNTHVKYWAHELTKMFMTIFFQILHFILLLLCVPRNPTMNRFPVNGKRACWPSSVFSSSVACGQTRLVGPFPHPPSSPFSPPGPFLFRLTNCYCFGIFNNMLSVMCTF